MPQPSSSCREVHVSNCSIMGTYINEEKAEIVEISNKKGLLTIVKRMEKEALVMVNRVNLEEHSNTIYNGECVEKSDFIPEDVYKKYTSRCGKGENEIEIEEFRIGKPELRPSHYSKLIGVMLLCFIRDQGIEKLKILKLLPSSVGVTIESITEKFLS